MSALGNARHVLAQLQLNIPMASTNIFLKNLYFEVIAKEMTNIFSGGPEHPSPSFPLWWHLT